MTLDIQTAEVVLLTLPAKETSYNASLLLVWLVSKLQLTVS